MIEKEKAGCIINKNNLEEILLLKTNYFDGLFVFPKGHLEDGETKEECVIREI